MRASSSSAQLLAFPCCASDFRLFASATVLKGGRKSVMREALPYRHQKEARVASLCVC
jgi:hypothetical protein